MNQLTPLSRRDHDRLAATEADYDEFDRPSFRAPRSKPQSNLLTEYLRMLARWKEVIALCAVAGALLSFCLDLGVLPVYQARTSLDIQSLNADFMNMHVVAATGDSSASSSGEAYVQTQVKLLQSTSLIDRTVARLKAEAHPGAIDKNDLLSQIKRTLHLSSGADLPYDQLVDDAAKRIKVKPIGLTRLVEVTCDSWDPSFSAKFCNTLTQEFRNADLETRGSEAQRTSEWLTRQVADIRDKAEESQRKLEAATGGDGLALSPENNSVGEDRLRALQGELVRAQAERMAREAQVRVAASASPDSIGSVADDPIYRGYQEKLADLNDKIAQLVPPLTEENPKVIHLRAQIHEVEAGMAQERQSTLSRLHNDFESSRHHEDLLTASYAAMQANVSSEMSKTARVNLLRREVDSEQQLYQTLLQRAKEAGFASALQATTIRVVDRAVPPKVPISPRRGAATLIGLLLGSFCGIGLALFRDRSEDVFREPGEAERLLQVHELGVIPSNHTGKRVSLGPRLRQTSGVGVTALEMDDSAPLRCWNESFSIVAEAYRNTTHSILLSNLTKRNSRVYIVTSPNSGEGKTTVTTNVGVALSKAKLRVVLVDGDLRKPGLHRNLLVENTVGLRNVLREELDPASAPLTSFCKQTLVPGLSLVPSGSGSEEVVELLHSTAAMERLMGRLAREFDVVLVDTPPMLHMADARILASRGDGVILVFRAGVTSRDQALSACELFEHDQIPLIGTILNDFNPAREGRTKYYQSYYRYKAASEQAEEAGVGL